MIRTIIYDDQIIKLEVDPSESDEFIYDRVKFILKNKKMINVNLMSKLYCNKKYKHLVYSNDQN